jgi:hypothetical protein
MKVGAPPRRPQQYYFLARIALHHKVDLNLPASPLRKGKPEEFGFESNPFVKADGFSGPQAQTQAAAGTFG